MRKLTLLLLLMVSTSVFAEWSKLGDSSDKESTVYADFGTIKRKGNKVKMWSLNDYKTVQKVEGRGRYLSSVSRFEYDCEEETKRGLDYYWYSRNMRQGETVWLLTNIKIEATSIIPGSIDEALFNIACSKK